MKQYRFRCYVAGLELDSVVNATNDQNAMDGFIENLNEKKFSAAPNSLQRGFDKWVITYEELGYGTTGVNIEETRAGVEMGTASVITG